MKNKEEAMMSEKKDRNKVEEIEKDINFINEILNYISNPYAGSAEELLNDWKNELEQLIEEPEEDPEEEDLYHYTLIIK